MPHISVVTPVYKAEGCLEELYRRLVAALSGITQDFEIVMVEDCGGDRSWEIIQALARKDARVKGMQVSRNFGQHYGITAGLDFCDGDRQRMVDCALQDRPEEIPRLYAKAKEGYEVVIASRSQSSGPLLKRFSSWLFYKLFSWLADMEYDGRAGNYRMISRSVVAAIGQMREQLRFFGALLNWAGYPTATLHVQHDERHEGRSTYTVVKLLRLASQTIIAYSDKPLRLAIRVGFLISLLAFCYGLYILVHAALYGSTIVGWASLIVSVYFIGGIIIAILGMLGIYLGRTYDETKKRPLYIVMHTTFHGGRKAD